MAALRTVAHFTGKPSSIPPIPKIHLKGSFPALNHNPLLATSLSVQPLGSHPTISSKRSFITVIESYERGLLFRSGKHSGEKNPGLRWSFPILNEIRHVDMRTRTMQVPSQELMTKDNVTIHVDAVAFYKVEDPLKALCNIENCDAAVNEAAQTSVRDQLSRATFDEVLHDRDEAGRNVLAALCNLTADWGVLVSAVKLKNIRVDTTMIRAMGRVAEAERVRSARLIEASAEHEASLKLVQAGRQYSDTPLSLRLREMQNHAQIAAESNTTMMIIPANLDSGVARALETLGRRLDSEASSRGCGDGEEAEKVEKQIQGKDVSDKSSDRALPKKSAEKPWYEDEDGDEDEEKKEKEEEDD